MPRSPDALFLTIQDGDLFINWNVPSALTKVTFAQGNTTNAYILSNFHTNFRVPHNDFLNYDEGSVNVSISHANSRDTTLGGISSQFGNILMLPFNAVQHMHSNNQEDAYTIVP